MLEFYWPWALLLLLLLPVIGFFMAKKSRAATITFSDISAMRPQRKPLRVKLFPSLILIRLLCIACLIVAIARPRYGVKQTKISTNGIAIELVVDCSGSMRNPMDYFGQQLNRLDVVKEILGEFILGDNDQFTGRSNDLIGLITYASYPETLCPLVHSHDILIDFLKQTKPIEIRGLGETAIGDAIALATARLSQAEFELDKRKRKKQQESKDSDSNFKIKSKIIILLTDGEQNAGQYQPLEAARFAAEKGIKIYTIGVASDMLVDSFFGRQKVSASSQINEQLLMMVAQNTDGRYWRAENAKKLKDIYTQIDKLEKTDIQSQHYMRYSERFDSWLWAAIGLLLLEIFLSSTVLRKIP